MNNLEFTAAQRRRELEAKYFPQGMEAGEIGLLTEVEQLLIKAYRAGAEQAHCQSWSNQSALGYVIMAAEQVALPAKLINLIVKTMHCGFDFNTIEEAAAHYRQSDY
ncbi:hypothetical protein [Paenibacillus sp. YIM B09110]|uniref:hypothetical protein n=1 Tax=Paenibacillus sp. YIM B09110 TaxID=3126102 RepID=UPI00301B956A